MGHEIVEETPGRIDHRFFDPSSPERPDDILGIDTEALLRLGSAATALGVLPYEVSRGLYALPDATRLFPLIEKMQTGDQGITSEDVRVYRKPIKNLSPGLKAADVLASGAGAVAIGIPLRRALNRRIEREFPVRAAEAIETARQNIDKIENEVDFVAEFDNPKEQFVSELQQLATSTKESIHAHHAERIKTGNDYQLPPTPKGFFGLFTKVARKVRGFFSFFKRSNEKQVGRDITAYDAAEGIDSTIRSLIADKEKTKQRLPIISNFILDRIPVSKLPSIEQLAFMAPEILTSIFSALPKDRQGDEILNSVMRNPHELRFVTSFKRRYGQYSLDGIQRATRTLLPAIRDVLPTEGKQIRQTFNTVRSFLEHQPKFSKNEEPEKRPKLRERIKSRIKQRSMRQRTA